MIREFCAHGAHDDLKCAVHAAMLAGAVCCFGYNAAAWYYRKERHNAMNAAIYGALCWLECCHIRHHIR